jgi:CO/xanthine dehydrogenase FAD-binding subunit
MDLPSVVEVVAPTERAELPPTGLPVAGGTWVFSEPQLGVATLIDLRALRWTPIAADPAGLTVAATATLGELAAWEFPAHWPAAGLLAAGPRQLLASFKVLDAATIGGNLALSYPAGAMIAVVVALDARILIWRADGTDEEVPAAAFVTGSSRNLLRPGDLIRSVRFPAAALGCPVALRKAAMADRGRSGVLLVGRTRSDGAPMLTVTAAVHRPVVLGPGTEWSRAGEAIDPALFVDDVHGAADWRRAVVGVLAAEIAAELGWS